MIADVEMRMMVNEVMVCTLQKYKKYFGMLAVSCLKLINFVENIDTVTFMKKSLTLCMAIAVAGVSALAESPLWLRNTAISPDGTAIAFTYKGSVYKVPSAGGKAVQLTSGEWYDTTPFWSPDGTEIAFVSSREGSNDIFVIPSGGGTPSRITTHSGAELLRGWLNDSTLLFTAALEPSHKALNDPFFSQTYMVEARSGARPQLYFPLHVNSADASPDGKLLFENHKSYENLWRKHEKSAGTSDIYLYSDGGFKAMTKGKSAAHNPVWLGRDGQRYAYIADDGETLNVFTGNIGGGTPVRVTDFAKHPVRSLSASADVEKLAFSWNGEIYTLVPGQAPSKVNVEIAADDYDRDHIRSYVNGGASNIAVSDDGDMVAFVLRGDVYVTSTKYKTTKRITDTPAQERSVSFAPDGRSLVYDSDRDGIWQLFIARIKDNKENKDKTFPYATEIEEELLYRGDKPAQQPDFSPDGKKVAFLEDRTELRVIDVDSKKVHTALDGKYNYSYTDGDVSFQWSPDSRWFLIDYIGVGGWNNTDIALVSEDGKTVVNLTESGYSNWGAQWALDGKAITYQTGKYGMKSHGSWGNEADVMLMVLDAEAWDRFNMTEEEEKLEEKAKGGDDDDEEKKKKEEEKKDKKVKPLKFDLDNRRYRTCRLTTNSSRTGAHFLNPKGRKLYYVAASTEGKSNLYVRDLRKNSTNIFSDGRGGGFVPDRKGENIFMLTGEISKINLESGGVDRVEFVAPYDRHSSLEREYIYGHAWRQVKDKFYDENLHGVDWDAYGENYRRFLPYINTRMDFAIMLSELLGELNASHTGASAGSGAAALQTASLGAYYDHSYTGDGLKIAEVLPRGPLSAKKVGIEAGDVITAIDGVPVEAGKDYYPLLDGKEGKNTLLSVRKGGKGKPVNVEVKPISGGTEREIIYQLWVERNEALVDSLSGGRIGYTHIRGMNSPSFRTAYDRILGKYRNCEAVIVDTRFNGGGWLHNDVAQLLSGKEYVRFAPRGRYIGSEPFSQWTKPSAMLVNEANYSDAHGTPYAYQALGIGPVVGAPVPGTMTAVWWENQIDPSIVFGIPQVTSLDINGNVLENQELQPDVEVYNTPAEIVSGNDLQIRAAVDTLLKKLADQ